MSLPRESSVKQLMNMKRNIKSDIGDKTNNNKLYNLNYVKGLSDINISSYEDFVKNKEGYVKRKTKKYKIKKSKNIKENYNNDNITKCKLCGGLLKKDIYDNIICENCGEIQTIINENANNRRYFKIGDIVKCVKLGSDKKFNIHNIGDIDKIISISETGNIKFEKSPLFVMKSRYVLYDNDFVQNWLEIDDDNDIQKNDEEINESNNVTGPDIKSKINPIMVKEKDRFNGGYMGPTKKSLYDKTNYKQKNNQGNVTIDLLRVYKHVIIDDKDFFIDKLEGNNVFLKSKENMETVIISVHKFIKNFKLLNGTFRIENSYKIKKFENLNTHINENLPLRKYPEDTYGIFKKLKEEFDIKKLKINKTKDNKYVTYTYTLNDGTIIECEDMGEEKNPILYINDKKLGDRRGEISYLKFFKEQEMKLNENILPKPIKKIRCLECGEIIDDIWKDKVAHVQNKHFVKPSINDDLIRKVISTCFIKK